MKWKEKKFDVCREFVSLNSTIQTIWEKTQIISAFLRDGRKRKRFWKSERRDVLRRRLSGISNRIVVLWAVPSWW